MQMQCEGPEKTGAATGPAQETKRDRVRRLLIDPLTHDGMRFKRGTPPHEERRRLDQMADDLAYLTDENLNRLRLCLRTKGEGGSRNFWPCRITILSFAEFAQPRALAEVPGLKSWFVSEAGKQAAAEPGRLLAEFQFWTARKRPPMNASEVQQIGARARGNADRLRLYSERLGRDVPLTESEAQWLDWATKTEAMLRRWMAEGRQA